MGKVCSVSCCSVPLLPPAVHMACVTLSNPLDVQPYSFSFQVDSIGGLVAWEELFRLEDRPHLLVSRNHEGCTWRGRNLSSWFPFFIPIIALFILSEWMR